MDGMYRSMPLALCYDALYWFSSKETSSFLERWPFSRHGTQLHPYITLQIGSYKPYVG